MSKPVIPPEHADKIKAVANELAMKALQGMLPEAKTQPLYVVATLSLALGHVANICKVSYKDLVELVGKHYENALLDEVQRELAAKGERMPGETNDPSKNN